MDPQTNWGTPQWYLYGRLSEDNPKLNKASRHYFENAGISAGARVRGIAVRDTRKICDRDSYDFTKNISDCLIHSSSLHFLGSARWSVLGGPCERGNERTNVSYRRVCANRSKSVEATRRARGKLQNR